MLTQLVSRHCFWAIFCFIFFVFDCLYYSITDIIVIKIVYFIDAIAMFMLGVLRLLWMDEGIIK